MADVGSVTEAVLKLRRSLLRGGNRSKRIEALPAEEVERWLYQTDQAVLCWYSPQQRALFLSDRYKHTPVQLPLELDGAAKDSGYAAEGSRDVPWKISSKDQNGIMLLLEAIPGWKRIMQGVMGRNLEFHKHVPWSLLEEDGKEGLVLERADGLVKGRLLLQMQQPAIILMPEAGAAAKRPTFVKSLKESIDQLDKLATERYRGHKQLVAAVERVGYERPAALAAAAAGLHKVLTEQQQDKGLQRQWRLWLSCGVCPGLVDAAARLGPADSAALAQVASTLCYVLRHDSKLCDNADVLGQHLHRSLMGPRTPAMAVMRLVLLLVEQLQACQAINSVQVLVGWLLPGLRYQYTQNGPRRRGPGMAAKCLEPPKDIAHVLCYPLLGPDGDDPAESVACSMSVREAAADLDMDDGLDPAQNTQLLVLRCLMALSAADAFSHATLQQPLPVNWVLDQILQPSAVALQYYAGSSPSKEAWRLRSGVMQQRALAMQVLVACAKVPQRSMPCPDDVCDTPPSLAIDPVITRIGNELLSLVRDAQQHRDQQQGDQFLNACSDLLMLLSQYLEGLNSASVVTMLFTSLPAAMGLVEVEHLLRSSGRLAYWSAAATQLLGALVSVYTTLLKQAATPGSLTYLLHHVARSGGPLDRGSGGGSLSSTWGEHSSGSGSGSTLLHGSSPRVKGGIVLPPLGSPTGKGGAASRLGASGSPRKPATDQHPTAASMTHAPNEGAGCLLQLAIEYLQNFCSRKSVSGSSSPELLQQQEATQQRKQGSRLKLRSNHKKLQQRRLPTSPVPGSEASDSSSQVALHCWSLMAMLLEACHRRPAAPGDGTENWQTPEKLLVEGLLSAPDANKQQRKHPVVLQQLLQELPLPRKMPIHFQVLLFEAAAFKAPDCQAIKVPGLVECLVPYHCKQVRQLYNLVASTPHPALMRLCRAHVKVLLVLTQRTDDTGRIRGIIHKRRLLPTLFGFLDASQRSSSTSPFEPLQTVRRQSEDDSDSDLESPRNLCDISECPSKPEAPVPQLQLQRIQQAETLQALLSSSAHSAGGSSAARRAPSTSGGDEAGLSGRPWLSTRSRDLEMADLTPKGETSAADAGQEQQEPPEAKPDTEEYEDLRIDPAAGPAAAAAVLGKYRFGYDLEGDLEMMAAATAAGLTADGMKQAGVPQDIIEAFAAECSDSGSDSEAEVPEPASTNVPRLHMSLVPGRSSGISREPSACSRLAVSSSHSAGMLSLMGRPCSQGTSLGMAAEEVEEVRAKLQAHSWGQDVEEDLEMWEELQEAGIDPQELNIPQNVLDALHPAAAGQPPDEDHDDGQADGYRRPDQLSPLPELTAEGSAFSSQQSSPESSTAISRPLQVPSMVIPALQLGSSSLARMSGAGSSASRSSQRGNPGSPAAPSLRLSSLGGANPASATPSVLHGRKSMLGSNAGAQSSRTGGDVSCVASSNTSFTATGTLDAEPSQSSLEQEPRDALPLTDPALLNDPELHQHLLQLTLQLMVRPTGLLCPLVEPQHTHDTVLQQHVTSLQHILALPGNEALVAALHSRNTAAIQAAVAANQLVLAGSRSLAAEKIADAAGSTARAVLRVLKLCLPNLYVPPARWGPTLASGAYGTIRSAMRPGQVPEEVVVKITDVLSASDIHTFQRVHTEITVLRHLDGVYGVIPLVEYGLSQGSQRSSGSGTGRTSDAWHLVFPRYSSSLRNWRQQLQHVTLRNPAHVAGLLAVFQQVVDIVASIHGQMVVHFDIKCDNVLINQGPAGVAPYRSRTTTAGALDGTGASGNISASSTSSDTQREKLQQACELLGVPAVTEVVLADFGDALWFPTGKPQTLRSRGTELFSSPEMLMLGTDRRASDSFDRRQGAGAGVPHDMWSLGCALFELLTGQVLFEREGVPRVLAAMRVKKEEWHSPILNRAEEQLLVHQELAALINWILRRDPGWRPGPAEVSSRLQSLVQTFSSRKK